MADPLTLAAVGAVALTEGIKFLYGQAGEALKRYRERKAAKTAGTVPVMVEPVSVELPSVAFEGQLQQPQFRLDVVERLEQELRELRAAIADCAQGIDNVDLDDTQLLETVDGLRRAMEAIYGQRIAFKGEPGPKSGVQIVGEAKVEDVLGYVAGLRAKRIIGGSVTGIIEAKNVERGGQAVGVEADTIGGDRP